MIPGGDAADQPAAADRDKQRIEIARLIFQLLAERALAEKRLGLIEGMHFERAGAGGEFLACGERFGIALAADDQLGALGTDARELRRRGHARHEDRRAYFKLPRRIGDGGAVIAAGGGDHSRRRNRRA